MSAQPIHKPKIIIVLGPTAVGKSALAVQLAQTIKKISRNTKTQTLGAEIISADSRQVYRGLDIGSGKITPKEMKGVPHHLLDVSSPKKVFTVAEFQKIAEKTIEEIINRGKMPIICGGTGFYIDALVDSIVFPEVPPNKKLRANLETKTTAELCIILKKIDRRRYTEIDKNNRHRLIRAIEIASKLGKVPKPKKHSAKYDPIFIGLEMNLVELEEKIRKRLISRLKKGMITEVRDLHSSGVSWKRLESFGLEYRAVAKFLKKSQKQNNDKKSKIKNDSLDSEMEMVNELVISIRQFAKRQMTWFKRNKRIIWFGPDEFSNITNTVKKFLEK